MFSIMTTSNTSQTDIVIINMLGLGLNMGTKWKKSAIGESTESLFPVTWI